MHSPSHTDPPASRAGAGIRLRVPGSSANLGPGFDALGLALRLYTTLTFTLLEEDDPSVPIVTLEGGIASGLAADESNLVYQVMKKLWSDSPGRLSRLRIKIHSQIPLQCGLGSSAAAVLGATWAAQALGGGAVDRQLALRQATTVEGHPDNAAASLAGGLVVCGRSPDGDGIILKKLSWPDKWCPLVVVPAYPLSTRQARAVLPARVPLADAVANVQNVALAVAAVATQDDEALRAALRDRLHEPYRQQLVPELLALREELHSLPILGCVLSGAGSSVLVLAARQHRAEVLDALRTWAGRQAQAPAVLDLQVDQEGIQQTDAL